MRYQLTRRCPESRARLGRLVLPRGEVATPVFMPVGTNGTVKTLRPEDITALGYNLILSNTYHLYLRPGEEVLALHGGLHAFMGFAGNILTDSGGFQVFSLSDLRRVRDDGVEFRSHIDGSRHFFSPERVIDIQRVIGSELVMPLDECTPAGIGRSEAERAEERTRRWAARARAHFDTHADPARQTLFGIVQGNMFPDLRRHAARRMVDLDFPGYAIGGLSVGEGRATMYPLIEETVAELPEERPRYLMGVGEPLDLVEAVARGIDMFDCVLPTRNARNASLFTSQGPVSLRNERFRLEQGPVERECRCPCCRQYSAAYLRHLFRCGEVLALELATLHNLFFLARLMEGIRDALAADRFPALYREFREHYRPATGK